uniref:L antigen family member 3 n=1 Tax=Canis lupus dingo TaxID=286419 RepID=A0A8C0K4Y5_CANLU
MFAPSRLLELYLFRGGGPGRGRRRGRLGAWRPPWGAGGAAGPTAWRGDLRGQGWGLGGDGGGWGLGGDGGGWGLGGDGGGWGLGGDGGGWGLGGDGGAWGLGGDGVAWGLAGDEASGPRRLSSGRCLNRAPSKLTVPFRTPLEAEMARRSLAPYVQRPRGLVQKELTVNGSALAIRWTAEDPVFFRISVNAFLDQLSLVMRNIRGFGSPPMRSLGRGKRTDT